MKKYKRGSFLMALVLIAGLALQPGVTVRASGSYINDIADDFTDKNFRDFILFKVIDKNSEDEISVEEIEKIILKKSSDASYTETIVSLDGLKHFTGLKELTVSDTSLVEELDLSSNINLTSLVIENNKKLKSLNLSKNTNLTSLRLNANKLLVTLNVSGSGLSDLYDITNLESFPTGLINLNISDKQADVERTGTINVNFDLPNEDEEFSFANDNRYLFKLADSNSVVELIDYGSFPNNFNGDYSIPYSNLKPNTTYNASFVFSYEKDSDDWETFKHEFSFTTLPYKVIFDANYTGAPSTSPSAIYATGANNTVETLPEEPTREGYTFLGWYPSDDGTGDRFTTSVSVPNDDYIVYAQWESITSPVSYTVTYDKNNTDANSTEANPLTQTVSQPATTVGTLPDPPTRAGYTFTGWNTAANGSGTAFTAATQVTANITVYAQWQQVTTPTNVYEITVTPASHTYPDLPTGYSSNSYWQDFVVENTGSNTVTSLSASFSSTVSGGTSKFNLDKAYKNISLAPGEKITIRVQPVSGLTANTYTDALIIKGDNGIDKVVTLTAAVVNAPTYRMTITPGTMIYNSAGIGYSNANMEQFFIISNNGSEELTQILYTMNNNYFEYSTPLTIESLKPGESARIGIRPLNALPVGTAPYTAVLTLRWANDGGTGVSAGLSFTVTGAPRYSLSVQAGQGGVITSGSGGQYAEGEAVNLSAVADVGYVFRRWSSSGGGVFGNAAGNNSTFIMPGGNTTVTAEFTPIGANGYTQYGDLNSDGTINNQDLVLILRYFAQPGININRTAADVNADGTINSADLVLLLRFFAQPGTVLGR